MKSKREIAVSRTAMTNESSRAMTNGARMAKGLAAFLMALALVFTFASCKTESEEETVYRTVTYSTEHATAPEKLTVTDGTALTAEQLPALTAEGYAFGGWYDGQIKAEAGYKVTKGQSGQKTPLLPHLMTEKMTAATQAKPPHTPLLSAQTEEQRSHHRK